MFGRALTTNSGISDFRRARRAKQEPHGAGLARARWPSTCCALETAAAFCALVRNDLKVDAGDRVEFVQIAPGRYELVAANSEVTALKGMFGPATKTVPIEAMNAAIAQRGAAAR